MDDRRGVVADVGRTLASDHLGWMVKPREARRAVRRDIRRRKYGPHRPEDAPTTVTVRLIETPWAEVEVERPAALVRQRKQINNRAWEDGQNDAE